ncbi:MAG: HAMP domain-containing histidine kinase [Ruminococcaceae bacterium]|nr:HAMP domain-containing histidine kinase [Oscillospiraceae bacterium]
MWDRARVQRAISWRYMRRFVVYMVVFTFLMAGGGMLVFLLLSQQIWYAEDPLYQFFNAIRDNLLLVVAAVWLVGMVAILFWLWRRVAKSFLLLTDAIERISRDDETPIELPDDLREVQGLLQQVQAETIRSRRAAEDAEQRKNDLVVYLAHDLKTPLTSVLGYLTLLRDEQAISPELRQKYLDIATGKAQRLEDLINEFFEITRFSLKGLVLEPVRFNFSRMLEQVTDEFRPLFVPKNLRCVMNIEPDIYMLADAGKLERVVDNLLRNAVSYSHVGSEIFVGAAQQAGMVSVLVRNQGDPIPQHKLDHIFEQFYRVDAARSGNEGGAGLGLAIAKEIVERHGGGIEVRSTGETIEFELALPVGEAVQAVGLTSSFSLLQPFATQGFAAQKTGGMPVSILPQSPAGPPVQQPRQALASSPLQDTAELPDAKRPPGSAV